MLVIDEVKLKTLKIQRALLEHNVPNKAEVLENYIKTITEIDSQMFDNILEQIEDFVKHNHSLEEELRFLEEIIRQYNLLLENQEENKDVCEKHGYNTLCLSDLSKINIEYIKCRVTVISSYLSNLKNIEENKKKLESLNLSLVFEEKKNDDLKKRLLQLEEILKNYFVSAKGRWNVDGIAQNISIAFEYSKLGFDLDRLLNDKLFLEEQLLKIKIEKAEASEKLSVAEVCYNNSFTQDNKLILNEIYNEFTLLKYKYVMLKIVDLIKQQCDDYDMFIQKRDDLLELLKNRLECVGVLGITFSIDPFSKMGVLEQRNTVLGMTNNADTISKIRKEISEYDLNTEEMIFQNNDYLITIRDVENLIINNLSINDISTMLMDDKIKSIESNQVEMVRDISSSMNMDNISQKTTGVINRVYKMISGGIEIPLVNDLQDDVDDIVEEQMSELIPSLDIDEEEEKSIFSDDKKDDIFLEDMSEKVFLDDKQISLVETDSSLFETLIPFEEPKLYFDKINESKIDVVDIPKIEKTVSDDLVLPVLSADNNVEPIDVDNVIEDEMPDLFWEIPVNEQQGDLVPEEPVVEKEEEFDAMVDKLIGTSDKVKKRIA